MSHTCRLLLVTGSFVLSTWLRGQSDDFNDGNDAGWTRFDAVAQAAGLPNGGTGSAWSFPTGGYRLNAAASPDADLLGPGRLGSLRSDRSYSQFCLSVDVRPGWNAKPDAALGLLARLQEVGAGTTNGYAFTYQTGDTDIQINRIIGEVPSEVSTAVDITLDPLRSYRFVFLGDGEYLEGRVYDLADLVTPLAMTVGFDSSFESGTCGLVVFDNGGGQGAVATFDNYVATALVPPALQVVTPAPGQFAVRWDQAPLCYKLQTSETLLAASWTDVDPADVTTVGTQFSVQVSTTVIRTRYFRLARIDPL